MRNESDWQPSKIQSDTRHDRWVPNPAYVLPASLFSCSVQVEPYARTIRENARGRLLDAGCGDVPYYGLYRPLVDEVVCVDWPGSSHGQRHVDQAVDLNAPLPFAAAAFDTVLLADVLEHIAHPRALIGELARVLAPGGMLLLTVPFLYWVHEAPYDYHRYTEYALCGLCADVGLEVVELTPYGGYPDVLLDLVSKGLVRGPALGRLYLAVFGRLARLGLYRRLRARTARSFPLGYCLVAAKPGVPPTGP